MTDSQAIKNLISNKGLKLQYVAEMLGITRYSLSLKINNYNEFKASEVAALCELLGINDLKEKENIFFAQIVD